jgi:solute carrier family 35 (UDP-sugar transporter), member A1/2/3
MNEHHLFLNNPSTQVFSCFRSQKTTVLGCISYFSPISRSKPTYKYTLFPLERERMVKVSKKSINESFLSQMFQNMNVSSNSFKLGLLILMVFQNSSVVLLGRFTRDNIPSSDLYVVNHLLLVCEAMKFFLSLILEYNFTNGNLKQSIKENIIDAPLDALKIIIPSLLYLIQNSLLYIALSNLTAPLFQVTYQAKLLTTAIVSVVMLQRRYSVKQWICLAALGLGVAIVVLGASDDTKESDQHDTSKPEQSIATGLFAVTTACLSSAFAGVYFEKVLKKPSSPSEGMQKAPVSLWMRNIQMAFFSVMIALINQMNLKGSDAEKPLLHGFTIFVWMVAVLQAAGGLLVAAIIKYADNVLKGLATGVSVVTSTVCSMILFGTPLTGQFLLGACLILGSVYLFSNDIPGGKQKDETAQEDVEMQKPLIKN